MISGTQPAELRFTNNPFNQLEIRVLAKQPREKIPPSFTLMAGCGPLSIAAFLGKPFELRSMRISLPTLLLAHT